MENGAFAPKEQMLHFPYYFQIHDILKASKGAMEKRIKLFINVYDQWKKFFFLQ